MKYIIISCFLVSLQVTIKAQNRASSVDDINTKNITTNPISIIEKQMVVKEKVSSVDMSKEKTNTKSATSKDVKAVIINETNSSVYIKPE